MATRSNLRFNSSLCSTIFQICLCFVFMGNTLAQTNIFQNTENDQDWNNGANWSLNMVPTSSHDVTLVSGVQVKIKTGDSGFARSITLSGTDTMIVQQMASLTVIDEILISGNAFFSNRGKTTFNIGSEGFLITTGGSLTNQDTITMNQPVKGIRFNSGTITNNGYIQIINPFQEGVYMYQEMSSPNYRHFYNNVSGHIKITSANDRGWYLADTLTNNGLIEIQNTFRLVNNVEANSFYVYSGGLMLNYGTLKLNGSDDHGLVSDGFIKNFSNGLIELTGFEKFGLYNAGNFESFGDVHAFGSTLYPQNAAILSNGPINLKNGSITDISGTYFLDYGIRAQFTLNIDTGAYLSIQRVNNTALFNDGGGINNHGTIEFTELPDTLVYGIVSFAYFNNYGTINMDDLGSGMRNEMSTFDNYGEMNFSNLISKAIFAVSTFTNHENGTINIYNNNGERMSWGIVYSDGSNFQNNYFTNNGIISIDSCHVGLALRQGSFVNNGTLWINHYRQAIDFGFSGSNQIPYFYNEGQLLIRNHEEPLAFSIEVELGDPFFQNFRNGSTGVVDFLNIHRGFRLSSGMINFGTLKMENVSQMCFRAENYSEEHSTVNQFGGTIDIINAGTAVELGYSSTMSNMMFFVNYGTFKLKNMTDTAIVAVNSETKFENYGTVMGDAIINGEYAIVNSFYRPGQNLGILKFYNYLSTNNFTYFIQVKGEAGMGQENGNDGIVVDDTLVLSGYLDVATLPGFTPVLENSYTIVKADTLIGTFISEQLPFLGGGLVFEVRYTDTTVVLYVTKLPKVWLGSCDSIWINPCNWFGGVPDSTDIALINGDAFYYPVLSNGSLSIGDGSGSQQCRQLIINVGGRIIIYDIPVSVRQLIRLFGRLEYHGNHPIHCRNGAEVTVEEGGELMIESP